MKTTTFLAVLALVSTPVLAGPEAARTTRAEQELLSSLADAMAVAASCPNLEFNQLAIPALRHTVDLRDFAQRDYLTSRLGELAKSYKGSNHQCVAGWTLYGPDGVAFANLLMQTLGRRDPKKEESEVFETRSTSNATITISTPK